MNTLKSRAASVKSDKLGSLAAAAVAVAMLAAMAATPAKAQQASTDQWEPIYIYHVWYYSYQTRQWHYYSQMTHPDDVRRAYDYLKGQNVYPWHQVQFWRWSPRRNNQQSFEVAAQSVHNSLVPAGNTVRGFGDSNATDQWVPFAVQSGGMRGTTAAKIVMVVKPIGQLIGTDELILKGASGKAYTLYNGFDRLAANAWQTVEVDVSGNADVMNAIRQGRLEGVIQDDSAVASVKLVVTVGP